MMKTMFLAAGVLTVAAVVTGCRSTTVAEVPRSQEELEWENVIRANYPGYRSAPSRAQAVYDNTEDRVSRPRPVLKPQEDAAAEVKSEKDAPAVEPAAEAKPADAEKPAAEVKPADAEKPAAEVKPADAEKAKVSPPDPTGSTVYEVKSGDTLGKIALKHYGSARHSNVIFKANSDILKNPNLLRPGMKLIIPKL
jgi:nucleoid-associated protein YgaU